MRICTPQVIFHSIHSMGFELLNKFKDYTGACAKRNCSFIRKKKPRLLFGHIGNISILECVVTLLSRTVSPQGSRRSRLKSSLHVSCPVDLSIQRTRPSSYSQPHTTFCKKIPKHFHLYIYSRGDIISSQTSFYDIEICKKIS